MEIKIQSVKFDADRKLIEFAEKKFSKLERFHDGIVAVDVTMSLLNDNENKNVKVIVSVPGNTAVVERKGRSFEDAINEAADIMKEKLTRLKEKQAE